MSDELSLRPIALNALKLQLESPNTNTADILQPLRALQRMGLSRSDLQIHVERMRAINEVKEDDPVFESNAVLALDMIEGLIPVDSLYWDPATMARIYVPRVLDSNALQLRASIALAASDLLPPRANANLSPELMIRILSAVRNRLIHYEGGPLHADFYRVPKAGLTTRPAALLALEDRIIFEALAGKIMDSLNRELSASVIWPRSETTESSYSSFVSVPRQWTYEYLVVTDIESFYECVEHVLLATLIGGKLGQSASYTQALEYFLDAIMGSASGLPQGPAGSEIFASAYLLGIDSSLDSLRWGFARFADDYLIGAESIVDGRRKIEELESALRQLGLRLNVSKTKVMRRETYLANLGKPSERVEQLRAEIRRTTEIALLETGDDDEVDSVLRDAGVEEQILWDLFYNHSVTLEEVIDSIRDSLQPPLVDAYAHYLSQVALELREKQPEDMLLKEQDLRECLLMLASARRKVNLSLIADILKWFPRLAQHTAIYLKSIANMNNSEVSKLVSDALRPLSDTDWVTGWLCNVPESCPELIDDNLSEVLRILVQDRQVGWLTRTAAVRALAAAGRLDEGSYVRLWSEATPAIRSELLWAQLADPSKYPDTVPAIEADNSD